ncbi:hypothetical protein CBF29_04895 [Vagococcus elongatus]|uniref:Uncharacterized protein n=1 Tax=Vagococcus elongatus TaxID=180344 RepID=A0A430AY60_9ENTE|nr:hypothetical protein CBF29_04895 [Vagococcus elongatus]
MKKKRSGISKNKQKKKYLKQFASTGKSSVNYICLKCGIEEEIPKDVVELIPLFDEGADPLTAPQFTCEKCGGEMYPEYYKNPMGIEFRMSDVR